MQVRVLIVDDDRLELNQFSQKIDWDSLEFNIVATAPNGIIGYKLYQSLKPDLIITDIEMPGLSGVKLAEKIREADLETHIVFLSSHEKFEYAHSGYKLGISDYILKQSPDQIKTKEILQRIKEEITVRKTLDESKAENILLQYFLGQVEGKYELRLHTQRMFCALAVFECRPVPFLQHYFGDLTLKTTILLDEVKTVLQKLGEILLVPLPKEGFLLFFPLSELNRYEFTDKRLDLLCLDVLETLNKAFQNSFYIVKLCANQTVEDIKKLYDQNEKWFKSKCFFSENSILDICQLQGETIKLVKLDQTRLSLIEKNADPDAFDQYLDQILSPIIAGKSYKAFSNLINQLLYNLSQALEGLMDTKGMKPVESVKMEDMEKLTCVKKIIDYVKQRFHVYFRLLRENRKYKYSEHVERAMRYIFEHFSDTNFSIKDIADGIEISQTRLGAVFKEETGITLHQYITDFRIDIAKQLLLAHKKRNLDAIAGEVGYINGKYLSRVFKKKLGLSPEVFRAKDGEI